MGKSSSEFVPKGKIAKTEEQFPTLGDAETKKPVKKTPVVVDQKNSQ
jgi:hypothetical protein